MIFIWSTDHIGKVVLHKKDIVTPLDLKQTFGVRCEGTLVSAENNFGFGA